MTTRRNARVNRAIQEAVSTAVLFKLKDPRVKNVTVLRAEATEDLRQARVYVSVMGDLKRQVLTMKGLNSARGFLQSKVAERLMTKQTPILSFVLDQSVKMSAEAEAALNRLFPVSKVATDDDTETDDDDLDDDDLDADDLTLADTADDDSADDEDFKHDDDEDEGDTELEAELEAHEDLPHDE